MRFYGELISLNLNAEKHLEEQDRNNYPLATR